MTGAVIRVALRREHGEPLADRLADALRLRKNYVQRIGEAFLEELGVGARLDVGVSLAELLAKFGVWSIVEGFDAPLDVLPQTVDVRIGEHADDGVLDLDSAQDIRSVFEAAARSPFMEPPLVIIGKGGSGTRILSESCRAMGIFIGTRINETADSLEMMDVGYVLLHEYAGRTELPSNIPEGAEELKSAAVRMLARGSTPLGAPWGWKLPETMLVLPLVLEAFPHAKILHVVRHPCGVSLKYDRHLTDRWSHHLGRAVLRGAAAYHGLSEDEMKNAPPWMQAAYSWVFQVKRVSEWCRANIAPGQYMEINIEDIGRDPKGSLKRAAAFAGVRWVPWSPVIDERRLHHWDPRSDEARDVWKVAGETAEKLGYRSP